MVEVKNVEVFGLNRAINAVGNSFNVGEINTAIEPGERILKVATNLGNNMDVKQCHDSWLKGILVEFDIKLNLATQPEFQRYSHFYFTMQQSRMHSIEKMLTSGFSPFTKYVLPETAKIVRDNYKNWVDARKALVDLKEKFENHSDDDAVLLEQIRIQQDCVYNYYMTLIHNLPCGIELWATVSTNYLQLKTMVVQRFHHKQKEDWMSFIQACYDMPKFRELCGFTNPKWDLNNW